MVGGVQILTVASGASTSSLHRDSALESANSDSMKVHLIEPGETLGDIAFSEYGEPSFMGVIQLCNDLPDRDRISVGQRINVPSLEIILKREGIAAVHPQASVAIVRVWRANRHQFWPLAASVNEKRESSDSAAYVPFPDSIRAGIIEMARLLESAADSLGVIRPGVVAPPARAISRLRSRSSVLREMDQLGVIAKESA